PAAAASALANSLPSPLAMSSTTSRSARGVVGVGPDQRHEAARTERLGDPRAAGEPEAGELLALVAAADRDHEAASLAELPGQGEREARSRGADGDGVEGRPLWRPEAAVAGE